MDRLLQNPETKRKKEDIVHPLRQITTNPMKQGGYGFNKTTLSERKGYKGVVCTTHLHMLMMARIVLRMLAS